MVRRKLTVDEVVEIKRSYHGFDEKLSLRKLADKYDVGRGAITDICKERSYVDIQIDKNGNYIDDVLPENFIIPKIEIEDKKIEYIKDKTTVHRRKFVKNYFINKNGAITPKSKKSKAFILNLWRSYTWLFNNDLDDFISKISLIVTETVMTANLDDVDWNEINVDGSKANLTLHNYVNQAIKMDVMLYANHLKNSYISKKDGANKWIKPDISSVDAVIENEDSESPIIETLSDKNNLFNIEDDYFGSPFLDWFKEEHKNILTDEQIRFLGIYKYFIRSDRHCPYTIPYNHLPKEAQPYTENSRDYNFMSIRNNTESAWEKVNEISLIQLKNSKELIFWEQFNEIVNDDEVDEQNEKLKAWILTNKDNEYFDLMLDELGQDEILQIRDKEISNKLLYKISFMIDERVKGLRENG